MDGVIYHGNLLLPGVREFVDFLKRENKKFLFLTNSSERAPKELQQKLERLGLEVDEKHFYTSALSTAAFLKQQCPGGSAYVIGEPGLVGALYEVGFTMNEVNPDYVVMGETHAYSFEKIERAVQLVRAGAKLIGTNPDLTGPVEGGIVPACKALMSPIELATGRNAGVFLRQAQSADDAPWPEPAGRIAGGMRHYRRPHGYRYRRGRGVRHRYRAGAQRRDHRA